MRIGLVLGSLLFFLSPAIASEPTAEELFQQRILPIFQSPEPSSCVECHLRGVDLKNYILPSAEQTFANLRDQGLIDLDRPAESRILEFIAMTPEHDEGLGPKIPEKLREGELAAFRSWILAAAADDRFRNAPPLPPAEFKRPDLPDEVIAHSRSASLLQSYRRNIWSLRFRCANCHHPEGEKFQKHAKEHGAETMAWLKAEGPAESMRYLMSSDLIDLDDPEQSELLLKPLDISDHGGGVKMRKYDTDYNAFLSWIQDYAHIRNGDYLTASDLPTDTRRIGTEIWVRIEGLSHEQIDRTGFLTLRSWNHVAQKWSESVRAITSGTVAQNKPFGVFFHGFLMVDAGNDRPLPPGKYLVQLHLDEGERQPTGWDEALKASTLVGSAPVEARWRPGFKQATVIKASLLKQLE